MPGMQRTYHFVTGISDGIPVALCLEHDLVVQAESVDKLAYEAEMMLHAKHISCEALGQPMDKWQPPPQSAIDEFNTLSEPGKFELTITAWAKPA